MSTSTFEASCMQWRQEREERLRTSERSWFNLAGMFWLKEGENSFGSDPGCDFVLPKDVPAKIGIFDFKNGQVIIKTEPDVKITCNGSKLPSRPLRDDQQEKPDYLRFSHFILVVIIRGTSTLIRLWDIDNPARKEFSGLNFFPYRPEYRFVAEYTGYAPYKVVKTNDIIGEVHDSHMIGYATFEWQGKKYRLDADDGGDGGLFLAFKDKTNTKATYAGGRYLQTAKPENDQVVLDFNQAYNMPCAYALYATCGLPHKDNFLSIPIDAGEKKYKDDH